jgi:hypothetical protein
MPKSDLKNIERKFMLVSVDRVEQGLNLCCWMSTENLFQWEKSTYPHVYKTLGNDCVWTIRSNTEMTIKLLAMCAETGDKICAEQIAINNRRKLANR